VCGVAQVMSSVGSRQHKPGSSSYAVLSDLGDLMLLQGLS